MNTINTNIPAVPQNQLKESTPEVQENSPQMPQDSVKIDGTVEKVAKRVLGTALGLIAAPAGFLINGPVGAGSGALLASGETSDQIRFRVWSNAFMFTSALTGMAVGALLGPVLGAAVSSPLLTGAVFGLYGNLFAAKIEPKDIRAAVSNASANAVEKALHIPKPEDDKRGKFEKVKDSFAGAGIGYGTGAVEGAKQFYNEGKKAAEKLVDKLFG